MLFINREGLIGLKQFFSTQQSVILKDLNTRDHLAWTAGNGDPMHEVCIPHTIPRAWEQQGRSRHKNNSKRGVTNMEKRNVDTKAESPKQGLTSAKDITIELPEGRESPYHRLD